MPSARQTSPAEKAIFSGLESEAVSADLFKKVLFMKAPKEIAVLWVNPKAQPRRVFLSFRLNMRLGAGSHEPNQVSWNNSSSP